MTDLIRQIEEVLTILHGPGSPESRVDRVTARLKAVQYEIEEQHAAAGYPRRVVATAGKRKGQHGTATGPPARWYELVQWDGKGFRTTFRKADLADEPPAQDATDRIALLLHDLAEVCDAAGTVRRPPAQIARWIRDGGPPRPDTDYQEASHG